MMRTPLREAAISGDPEALRRELEKGPVIDEYDNFGFTLLHDLCSGRGSAGSDRLACFHLGGYRNYERDHLNALSGIFVPKFARLLPPEMVRRVVEYAFDVGGHFRGH